MGLVLLAVIYPFWIGIAILGKSRIVARIIAWIITTHEVASILSIARYPHIEKVRGPKHASPHPSLFGKKIRDEMLKLFENAQLTASHLVQLLIVGANFVEASIDFLQKLFDKVWYHRAIDDINKSGKISIVKKSGEAAKLV